MRLHFEFQRPVMIIRGLGGYCKNSSCNTLLYDRLFGINFFFFSNYHKKSDPSIHGEASTFSFCIGICIFHNSGSFESYASEFMVCLVGGENVTGKGVYLSNSSVYF